MVNTINLQKSEKIDEIILKELKRSPTTKDKLETVVAKKVQVRVPKKIVAQHLWKLLNRNEIILVGYDMNTIQDKCDANPSYRITSFPDSGLIFMKRK